jgi:hypothetical protein
LSYLLLLLTAIFTVWYPGYVRRLRLAARAAVPLPQSIVH